MEGNRAARRFFNDYSKFWDSEAEEGQFERIAAIFHDKLSFIRAPFLDLGSGTGVLIPILKKYDRNGEIIELDIAVKMLQLARRKFGILSNTRFLAADAHHLPLPADYFGSVLCFQVYPHFHDKSAAAREIYASLKTGGYLIILHLMGHKELNELHRKAGRAVENDRILPAVRLAELLEDEGFSVIEREERSDIYLIIAQKRNLNISQ
jgi:demethylmenaquinone methyltransferase/2-methoxy-6-polyprenyl-1,4-benzoquinol methylase